MADKPAKAPAYQWFPKDAESDETYRLMSCEELGVYERLRDHQWFEGSLPPELEKIAILVGHGMTLRRLQFLWPKIAPCFPDDGTGRLANPRLERQRLDLATYIATRKLAGRAGGLAKHKSSSGSTTNVPQAKPSTASATAPAPAASDRSDPISARSGRPIFTGTKFVVFEWQLTNCVNDLGGVDEAEKFGLDEWFHTLNADCERAQLIIPKRDGGAWLQSQLLAEAQRRGLPIRMAVSGGGQAGKLTTRMAAALANIKAEAR